ncbi:MAG: M50 family metallopeptidase [Chloroflexota bacterium]
MQIGRSWATIKQEPLTRAKQRLAEQAAFFISVPPSVLIHELFHALAIWLFGGQVVEFAYRVFWGYVVPAGDFTPVQNWFIALAGPLGSLLFGVGIWLALRHNASRTLRYFGLRSFRFQVYFSLLYYPLISLVLPIGDWRIIYAFGETPWLSAVTIVLHVGLLLAFWRADRAGWFEMPAFETAADQARFEQLEQLAAAGDVPAQLQVIDTLRFGGAGHQAQRQLDSFLTDHPESADGLLLKAMLSSGNSSRVDSKTADYAQQALDRRLDGNRAAIAREMLARHHMERGEWAEAETELTRALALGPSPQRRAQLLYWRSQTLRHLGRFDEATRDITEAIALAHATGDAAAEARYTQELEVIHKHGGMTTLPSPVDKPAADTLQLPGN